LIQVKLALAVHQVTLTAQAFEQLGSMFANDKGHLLATIHHSYRNNPFSQVVGHKSIIKGERTVWLEGALCAFVELVGIRNFGKDAYGDIGRDTLHSQVSIAKFVESELSEYTRLPSHLTNVIARSIGSFQRLQKQGVLVWRRLQLHTGDQFHTCILTSIAFFVKCQKG